MQNSWYVKEEGLHHFYCKCGQHTVVEDTDENLEFEIIDFKKEEIDFTEIPNIFHPNNKCKVCHNEKFLDIVSLLFDGKTKYWSNINWDYKKDIEGDCWKITAFVDVPKCKILTNSRKEELYSFTIMHNGKIYYKENNIYFSKKYIMKDGKYYPISRLLKSEVTEKIIDCIVENPSKDIAWLKGEVKTIEGITFFLENKNILFLDILKWKDKELLLEELNKHQYLQPSLAYILNHRTEKSLKKAQFISYEKMMLSGGYNPMVDYIFSRSITDVNHLCRLLSMNIKIKQKLFDGCDLVNIFHFIDFLKNHYETKHIVRFWLNITNYDLSHFLLRDCCRLFANTRIREELNKSFNKTTLNIRTIHDELILDGQTLESLGMKNKVLTYDDRFIASQVSTEGIFYVLPFNHHTLYEWGKVLHNCVSSYSYYIDNGISTLWGLFIEEKLMYVLEIRRDKIVQVSADYNRRLDDSELDKVKIWHNRVYMVNMVKSFD